MSRIMLTVVIGLILGVVTAVGGTARSISKSNIVGGNEGTASDFTKEGRDVLFHEMRDRKKMLK